LWTAEQIAHASPCTLAQIDQRLREIHPGAPPFSLDCLSTNLKKRGLSFTRTRLSLKKNAAPDSSKPRGKPDALPGGGTGGKIEPVLTGRKRIFQYTQRAGGLGA
jgi:hypothetical protein